LRSCEAFGIDALIVADGKTDFITLMSSDPV
jgi:tRNA G18 (ribose-2'-O)-methylase SpoU